MTKINLSLFLSAFCILSTFSCTSGQQTKNPEFTVSKIYPSITCVNDTTQKYALFLPPQYKAGKPCPVLILFDPHGDGLLPVNLFSAEAAKKGFILAGSNNSKNGIPYDLTTAIYKSILNDLSKRFSIEKRAIYLGGFSGGSRVAGAVAMTESGIAGVVGCGAGLPNIALKAQGKFSYLAVSGNQDFNLTEMQQLNQSLEEAGYQHHLLVFDGIHQWPVKELIPDIFTWLRFDAMRQKSILKSRNEINSFIEKNNREATAYGLAGNPVKQQEVYVKMVHYLQGLTNVTPIKAEISRLANDKKVVSFNEQQKQLLQTEQNLQQKYSPEIQRQNLEWWKKETSLLQTLSVQQGNPEMNQVYKRVLGFLSLNCYMYSNGSLKQGDLEAASKYVEIYHLVDPANVEHRYMAAKIAALKHNPVAMFDALKQAFDLGFNDISRLKADAAFKPYQQDERFKNLVAGK